MTRSLVGRNIPALTGLRWIAALLVILRHNPPPRDSILYPVFSNGHGGVTLFFVLSGFVLTINYFDKFPALNHNSLMDFYVARIARIYPLYLTVLVGYGIVFRFDEQNVVVQHLLMIQAWSSNSDVSYAMNGPGWSLGVEVFFYIVFPFVILSLRKILMRRGRAEALLVCCLSLIFIGSIFFEFSRFGDLAENDPNSMWRWLYRNPAFRIGDFLAGVALGSIYIKRDRFAFGSLSRALTYAPWFTLCAALSLRSLIDNPLGVDFVFAVISCGIIFSVAVVQDSAIARFLSIKPLKLLGEFSFAAYLVHVPIRQGLSRDIFGPGFTFGTITLFVWYLVIVILISGILHYIVERPARSAVRRVFSSRS